MRKRWPWIVGALALLALVVSLLSYAADEPLRRRVEAQMNASLKGYKATIRELDLHPLGLSVDVVDGVIIQEAHPDPPVAWVPRLHASVQWLALLRGKLVADFRFERPELYIDQRHAAAEAKDPTPLEKRGWQEAALAIFPLKVNLLRIEDGKLTYLENGPLGRAYLWDIDFRAGNIRNVRSGAGEYPSDVQLRAKVLESAALRVDGHADFLAVPHAGIQARFDLEGLRLAYLEPILREYDLAVRKGTLSAAGEVEYAPKVKKVELARVALEEADLDYVKRRAGQPTVGEKAAQTASTVTTQPTVAVRAKEVRIDRGRLGYTNETTDPPYHLFVGDCNVKLANFSNLRTADGAGDAKGHADVSAKFMDSGDTTVHADFRPQRNGADFNLALRIENADVRTMNDLWQAYGKFDTEGGTFSLYSELAVADGRVQGYVKPLFKDLEVFDPSEEKGVGQKIYEGLVGGVATLLENRSREQVATVTDLSGPLDNPHTSTLDIFTGLVRNAFFKAILPGLERNRGGDAKK